MKANNICVCRFVYLFPLLLILVWGTTDMIFAAKQIQEKCSEQYHDVCMVFIDLTKATL